VRMYHDPEQWQLSAVNFAVVDAQAFTLLYFGVATLFPADNCAGKWVHALVNKKKLTRLHTNLPITAHEMTGVVAGLEDCPLEFLTIDDVLGWDSEPSSTAVWLDKFPAWPHLKALTIAGEWPAASNQQIAEFVASVCRTARTPIHLRLLGCGYGGTSVVGAAWTVASATLATPQAADVFTKHIVQCDTILAVGLSPQALGAIPHCVNRLFLLYDVDFHTLASSLQAASSGERACPEHQTECVRTVTRGKHPVHVSVLLPDTLWGAYVENIRAAAPAIHNVRHKPLILQFVQAHASIFRRATLMGFLRHYTGGPLFDEEQYVSKDKSVWEQEVRRLTLQF